MFPGIIRKTSLAFVTLSVFLAFSPLTAIAQGVERQGPPGGFGNQRQERPNFQNQEQRRGAMKQKMMEKFGITPEQMEEFKSIRESSKAEAKALKTQIKQKRQEMMQYMQSPDATEAGALAKNREMADLMARVGELRIKALFQMKSVMTPEQYEQFVAHRKQAREKRKGRRGGQGGFRRGGGGFGDGGDQGGFGGSQRRRGGQRFQRRGGPQDDGFGMPGN